MNTELLVCDSAHLRIDSEINPYVHTEVQPDPEAAATEHAAIVVAQHRISGAKGEHRAIELEHAGVLACASLFPAQARRLERRHRLRIGDSCPRLGMGERREGLELPPPPLGDEPPELGVVIGEEQKGRARRPLLPLEQERGHRPNRQMIIKMLTLLQSTSLPMFHLPVA